MKGCAGEGRQPESQAAESVRRALDDLDLDLTAYTLAPCWDDPPYYALLLEARDVPAPGQGQSLALGCSALAGGTGSAV